MKNATKTTYLILFLAATLGGCSTNYVEKISMYSGGNSSTTKISIPNIVVEDYTKLIPATGLSVGIIRSIEVQPFPHEVLQQAIADQQMQLSSEDKIKVSIADITYEVRNAFTIGSSRLKLLAYVEISRGNQQNSVVFNSTIDKVDVPAGFNGIPYKDLFKESLIEACEEIAVKTSEAYSRFSSI